MKVIPNILIHTADERREGGSREEKASEIDRRDEQGVWFTAVICNPRGVKVRELGFHAGRLGIIVTGYHKLVCTLEAELRLLEISNSNNSKVILKVINLSYRV